MRAITLHWEQLNPDNQFDLRVISVRAHYLYDDAGEKTLDTSNKTVTTVFLDDLECPHINFVVPIKIAATLKPKDIVVAENATVQIFPKSQYEIAFTGEADSMIVQ